MKDKMGQSPAINSNPVLSVEKDGTVLYSNETGELILYEWGVEIGGKLPSTIGEIVQKVISENSPEKMEVKVGKSVYLVVFHPVPGQEYVSISGFDVSDQKEHEEKLLKNEDKYYTLLNSIDQGFSVIDVIFDENDHPVDLFYVESNAAAIRILGRDYTGKRLSEIDPNYESYWYETFGKVAKTGQSVRMELYAGPDKKWYSFYVFKVGEPDGRRIGNIFLDITGSKHCEENLAFLAEINEDFAHLPSVYEIMQTVGEKIGKYLNVKTVNFYEVDDLQGMITVSFGWQATGMPTLLHQTFCISDYLTEEFRKASRAGETIVIHDTNTDSRTNTRAYAALDIGSAMTVPFHVKGEWKAFLSVTDTHPREWLQDEIELFQELSSRIFPLIERSRAKEALRESEERFRVLIEAASKAVWETDSEGVVVTDSPSWRAYTGQTVEKWFRYGWLNAVHPDDREYAERQWREAVAAGCNINAEFRLSSPDGGWRWTNVLAAPIRDADGRIIKWVGMNLDITESKQAEELLRKSEAKFRYIVETAQEGIWLIGRDARTVFVNQRLSEMLGYSINEILGQSPQKFMSPEFRAKADNLLREQMQGISHIIDYQFIRKDGSDLWSILSSNPLFDERGKYEGSLAMITDITERKRADEKLRQVAEIDAYRVHLTDILRSLKNTEEIKAAASRILCEQLQADRVYYSEIDPKQEYSIIPCDYCTSGKSVSIAERYRIKYLSQWLFREGRANRPVIVADVKDIEDSGAESAEYVSLDIRAFISYPLIKAGRLEAILGIIQATPRQWQEEDLAMIRETAERTWAAVERGRAEEALRESEELLRLLSDNLPDSAVYQYVLELDGSTHFVYFSAGIERLNDIKVSDVLHDPGALHRQIPPEYFERLFEAEALSACDLSDFDMELPMQLPDGQVKWMRLHSRPRRLPDGRTIWDGVQTDVTEIKQAEKVLRDNELRSKVAEAVEAERQRFFDVLETLPVMIALLTPDHQIAFANRFFREKFGESEGRHCYEHCFGSNRPCEFCESYKVLETCQPHHWEVTTPEGSVIDVYSFPFADVDGSPMILKMDIDITERRKAEERLRDSEEKYRNIVETANEVILITDDKAVITYVNPKITDMLGYTQEEVINRPIWGFICGECRSIVKRNLEKRRQGISESYELKLIRKDRSSIWTFLNAKPLFDKEGKYAGAVSMLTDITKRKEAEEALANIETARKKEIHHRIKNNLQVISSLLDLQAEQFRNREDIKESEILEAFRESQDRVISMALIHEELYRGGGFETLNFSPYIQELTESLLFIYRLGSTDVSLKMDLEKNLLFDMDTAVPLGMIVNELVSNSLKHAFPSRKKGEIRIKLSREEKEESMKTMIRECKSTSFILTVSDDGVGIPENLDIENLDSLGFQLVTSLVDQLDGEFELKRKNGTEFTMRFTVTEKMIWFNSV